MNPADPVRLGLVATIKADPGSVAAYVEAHQAIWQSVLEDARAAGVRLTCIFRDDRRLFMFMEAVPGFDLDAFAAALSNPSTLEWQRRMDLLLDDQPGAAAGLKWRRLDVVVVAT